MNIQYQEWDGGSFYVITPVMDMHSPLRRYGIVILRDSDSRDSVERLVREWKLEELAQQEACVIVFPNLRERMEQANSFADIEEYLKDVHNKMCEPEGYVFSVNDNGIPSVESMINRWHLMNDTRYYVGIGEAAQTAAQRALSAPFDVTALYLIPTNEEKLPLAELEEIHMPFRLGNEETSDFPDLYRDFFAKIRRLNTGEHGDVDHRMNFDSAGFEYFLENKELFGEAQNGRTWFVHVPSQYRGCEPEGKLPMVMFFHGGSDNPAEAAQMSRFHEIGEREGFITVYPWGSDTASWNCNHTEDGYDDVEYIRRLIAWMREHYPVDETRIYLSGFSNGAAIAQVYAMEHPEQIAAICHVDSNWPGKRFGPCGVEPEEVIAFRKAWEKKKEYDYLMPVWYTYGSREASYPVYRGSSQQVQYDFWKAYNHIAVRTTPERDDPDPTGCGVRGDVYEEINPSTEYPGHRYQINRFYINPDTKQGNLYNYVVMHEKGHEVAPMDCLLGWEYVRQYRRNPDGSLGRVTD